MVTGNDVVVTAEHQRRPLGGGNTADGPEQGGDEVALAADLVGGAVAGRHVHADHGQFGITGDGAGGYPARESHTGA